ncbi:MAG: FkbM family methyltransferase [Anaerolineales bacterium]
MKFSLDPIFNPELQPSVSESFWLKPGVSIYIYGTGTVGQDVWNTFSAQGISVAGFMDNRNRGTSSISGVPILQPDSVANSDRGQAVIVLAIHNREVDMRVLIGRLKALGYPQFITMIDLYDHFASELGTRYWLASRTIYRDFETQINATHALWADDLSRETFARTLQFRITGDFSVLPEPDLENQYFPPDLPPWKQPFRMIDCGAYDGDAIRAFIKNGATFSALAAFEPDLQNYVRLVGYIEESGTTFLEVSLWPCGVHATSCQLRFTSGVGEASSITDSGETIIQCVALEDALPKFAPTLIKMDIEGSEMDALLGARNLIATYQPGLAISVYHTSAHLWEIPLWVARFASENGINYTYHLRSHAYNCFDTVFYAIPSI